MDVHLTEPHGGDLGRANARYGPREDWLDLSTGISPFAWPLARIGTAVWRRLPQSDRLSALIDAARDAYGAGADAAILPAPGSEMLIGLLALCRRGVSVAVAGPTYGGHASAWRRSGATVEEVSEPEAARAEILVLVNPNNPDGRVTAAERVLALADRCARRGGLLVVDEAFADCVPEASVAAHAGRPGLLILRSFGKFFGLAGLRLGFALGPREEIERLAARIGPWAVSGPAIEIGIQALRDRAFIEDARARQRAAAARLDELLAAHGLTVIGGTPLFRLVSHPAAAGLQDRLARAGILVRRFDHASAWLRFGLPGEEAAWARLAKALAELIS